LLAITWFERPLFTKVDNDLWTTASGPDGAGWLHLTPLPLATDRFEEY
jgi:hypothetical protein